MSNFLESVIGYHGNHVFYHNPNMFILWTSSFDVKAVLLNKLTPMENCPRGQGKLS